MGARGSMTDVDVDRCWELMASRPVGRLGMVVDSAVAILPVNHTVQDGAVYFRTSAYGTIARHVDGSVVAFEVDRIVDEDWSGWSVQVQGCARKVDDPETLARLWTPTRLHPWAPGIRNVWIEIRPDRVTGRVVRS
ncbi:UNVERIFIED_CONTAM: hypothetical protein LK11_45885 [Mumia flava]